MACGPFVEQQAVLLELAGVEWPMGPFSSGRQLDQKNLLCICMVLVWIKVVSAERRSFAAVLDSRFSQVVVWSMLKDNVEHSP